MQMINKDGLTEQEIQELNEIISNPIAFGAFSGQLNNLFFEGKGSRETLLKGMLQNRIYMKKQVQ